MCKLSCGVKIAIQVIVIRVNLIVYPILCYRCHTHCIRFNSSSKILSVIAEGSYLLNQAKLTDALLFHPVLSGLKSNRAT